MGKTEASNPPIPLAPAMARRRRRRRRRGALQPTFPLDGDDILREILVRLPTEPSSLPRASLVCKEWLRVVSDPAFLRRYRAHHEKPLLLGVFVDDWLWPFFRPALDSPDRVPQERFLLPLDEDEWASNSDHGWDLLGCRHGRVLAFNRSLNEAIVWDPATGDRRSVAAPPEFNEDDRYVLNGAVLCAATDEAHVHGDCHSSPFRVVLVGMHCENNSPVFAASYSSKTGEWGDVTSIECRPVCRMNKPSTLIGSSLYWMFDGEAKGILEFDLATQSLAVIEMPPEISDYCITTCSCTFQIVPAEDGDGLSLAKLSSQIMKIWERKISSDGAVTWVMQKKIDLCVILGLGRRGEWGNFLQAYDEGSQFLFIWTRNGVFMIHLESMRFKNLGKEGFGGTIHPYSAFCTAVGDLVIRERRVDGITGVLAMNDSVSAEASRGAGASGCNTAGSSGTSSEEGMVNDENLENTWNHTKKTRAGFKCGYSKRIRSGCATWLKQKHRNGIAFSGVRPKIMKYMRVSLSKVKQRKKVARNHQAREAKTNLQSMASYGDQSHMDAQQLQMTRQASLDDFHFHHRMECMDSTFEHGDISSDGFHRMDAELAHSGEAIQIQMDTSCDKEATSKLGEAWAKWFLANGIPGVQADCPHFRHAMEVTQQLGAGAPIPTGAEIDAYLDSSEEED